MLLQASLQPHHQIGACATSAQVVWRDDTHLLSRLTYLHTERMVFRMKTTLNIDDTVMARLKREAARSGRTMSELVETALRTLLRTRATRDELPPLPAFDGGGAMVDIADRDALYRAMEGR